MGGQTARPEFAPALQRYLPVAQTGILYAISCALPWELYQRIPFTGLTVVKVGAVFLLALAALEVLSRRQFPRVASGVELPLLLVLLFGAASSLFSLDRQATFSTLSMYLAYAVFFYCTVIRIRSAAFACGLLKAFTISSGAVACASLLCKAGLIFPTAWNPVRSPWQERVFTEAMNGTTMRMAAASADSNQGALPLALAFGASLFLFNTRQQPLNRRFAILFLQCLLVIGVIVTYSRISIFTILALGLIATLVAAVRRGRAARFAMAFGAAAAVAVVLLASAFSSFFFRQDQSIEVRAQAYRTAVSILPQYALTGTGLGASDAALAKTEYGDRVLGHTLHSVHFKFLIELGLVGFVAYAALWIAALWRMKRNLALTEEEETRRLAQAGMSGVFVLFAILAVQPFTALPAYPFLAGVALGPLSKLRWGGAGANGAISREPVPGEFARVGAVAAAALIAALVSLNIALYQSGIRQAIAYADRYDEGTMAELEGLWPEAVSAYEAAMQISDPTAADVSTPASIPWTRYLATAPFYDVMDRVVDLTKVYETANLANDNPNPLAAALFAAGRVLAADGQWEPSVDYLSRARKIEPANSQYSFVLAEVLWKTGRFQEAIRAYSNAALHEELPSNRDYAAQMRTLLERIQVLQSMDSPGRGNTLELAYLLRQRGRWPEALQIYERLGAVNGVPSTEALFNLGVNEDIEGRADNALTYYRAAVDADPGHYEAARRLRGLAGPRLPLNRLGRWV